MSGGKSERDRPGFAGMMIRTISAALIVELLAGGTIYFNKDGYAIAVGVADQIETTTEPGASRKALPERMNQQRPGNAKRWFAGACALCALPRIQVDRAFQKLVDRFLNHLFDGKPLLGSDDFQLLQGPLRNR